MIFTEESHFAYALLPDADRYSGSPATQAFNMKLYEHITFVLIEGAGGAGTCTITVEECATAAGGSPVAIPFRYRLCTTNDVWGAVTSALAAGYLTLAAANKMVAIEIDAEELSADKPFVRLQLTVGVATAVDAGVVAILSKPRYTQAVMPTAIA